MPIFTARTMNQDQMPIPGLGRMMVFIDGENLVFRFKTMLAEGRVPRKSVIYEPDIYVWHPSTVRVGLNQVIRATYYTYAFGSEVKLKEINEQIKNFSFQQYSLLYAHKASDLLVNKLYPRIFRKYKNKKAKGVDIQMTADILSNVYMNNLNTVYLVSGDGDYKPVIDEIIRHGKHTYIAALSSGLNLELKFVADKFINLDPIYFESLENGSQ